MPSPQHYNPGLIAEDIMHIGVIMVDKNDTFLQVLRTMDRKNISAVVVEDMDDPGKYYLISHSDIIHFLVKQQDYIRQMPTFDLDLFSIQAKHLMRGPIDVISRNTPIDKIINIMDRKGYKRVIVGNDRGQPVGIVSTRDILAWNNKFFRKGTPFLLTVMENDSGIIISKKFFRQEFAEELLELFGGSISAIASITSEVLKESGNLRIIEKDYYHIMLEPREQVTAILIADYSSLDLRRKLQIFIDEYLKLNEDALKKRKLFPGSLNAFRMKDLPEIFLH